MLNISNRPSAIDVFCGAGGLSLGLSRAGFDVVLAVDSSEIALRTYQLNLPHATLRADISSTSGDDIRRAAGVERVDLLAGGPPCQGFSVQRIGNDSDPRNHLVREFARLVSDLKPRVFLMENVPGILGKRGRDAANALTSTLARAGYEVRASRLDAADYGVPQHRQRVFFYGWLRAEPRPFTIPKANTPSAAWRTVWDAIGDLESPPDDYTPSPDDGLHRRTRLSVLNEQRLRLIPPGGGFENLPVELRVNAHKNGASKIGHRYVYGRLPAHEPAATITARFDSFTRGRFAHPFEHRNITLREGARLQTFDDDFTFAGTQEQIAEMIGNAVPPLLAEIIGTTMFEALTGSPAAQRGQAESPSPSKGQMTLFE